MKIQLLSFVKRELIPGCLPGWVGGGIAQAPSTSARIPSHPAPWPRAGRQAGALPAGCLLRVSSSEKPLCLHRCPGPLSHFNSFLVTGGEDLAGTGGGETTLPVLGCSGCKAHLHFSSSVTGKQILEGLSPHLHVGRVSPWLMELNFGSKHGIYTGVNNVQEHTTHRKLLMDQDVIH